MPGVYKLKKCPVCDIEHRKRGLYCSASHAASARRASEETKAKMSEAGKARFADKESDAYLDNLDVMRDAQQKSKGIVRDPIPPRMRIDRDGETIDGDYWTSVDDW